MHEYITLKLCALNLFMNAVLLVVTVLVLIIDNLVILIIWAVENTKKLECQAVHFSD